MADDQNKPEWAMSRRERADAARAAAGKPPKPRRRWIWGLVLLLAAAGGVGYGIQSGAFDELRASREAEQAAAEAEAEERAARAAVIQLASFEVATVASATLTETLKITGSLAPVREVHIAAEVTAEIETVNVRAGDAVAAGDILVTFDTAALDIQLEQASANAKATRIQLLQARADYERTLSMVDRGISTTTSLDRARTTLNQLEATLEAQTTMVTNAERARKSATVAAPFDGVVSERSVNPGQFAATGAPLVTVVDLSAMEIEATVPLAHVPDLARGMPVRFAVEGFGERAFTGQIARLAPMAIQGSRMLPVYIAIDNPGGELRGGMFASGQIVLEARADALGLPAGALRQDPDGAHVIVIEDQTATRRAVEVVRTWDGGGVLEISAGLQPGDIVVIEPLPELRIGDTVELLEAHT